MSNEQRSGYEQQCLGASLGEAVTTSAVSVAYLTITFTHRKVILSSSNNHLWTGEEKEHLGTVKDAVQNTNTRKM